MFRKDYLQRQFEEFGKVLASLLALKKNKDWEEFEKQAAAAVKKFTALDLLKLEEMDLEIFRQETIENGSLSYDQKKIIATLLFEKMHVFEETDQQAHYASTKQKCLSLYKHLSTDLLQNEYDLEVHYRLKLLQS